MVNLDFENAFFIPPPFGPEKTGGIAFGRFNDGTPIVSADTVAHEIMHGVTHFSVRRRTGERGGLLPTHRAVLGPSSFTVRYPSGNTWTGRCGTRYRYGAGDCYVCGRVFFLACDGNRLLLFMDHGGTVHESFSDVVGTAVEFSVHSAGSSVHADGRGPLRADYLIGEDAGTVFRSLRKPRSIRLGPRTNLRYPDAYADVVRFRRGVLPRQARSVSTPTSAPSTRRPSDGSAPLVRLLGRTLELDGPQPRLLPRHRGRAARDNRPQTSEASVVRTVVRSSRPSSVPWST